jgi:hypothetical protein
MADVRQPGFVTALVAVAVGGVVSSWISALLAGLAPATSMETWAILTSVFGAVGVKLVLRVLGYDVAFAFAAGALLAGRIAGLVLIQALPDLGGHPVPELPTFGLYSSFPSLLLSAWIVQITAGRTRTVTY